MANACKAAIKSLNSKQKLAVQGSGNQGFGNGDAGRDLCFAHVTHRYKFLPVPGFPQLKISVAGQPNKKTCGPRRAAQSAGAAIEREVSGRSNRHRNCRACKGFPITEPAALINTGCSLIPEIRVALRLCPVGMTRVGRLRSGSIVTRVDGVRSGHSARTADPSTALLRSSGLEDKDGRA